MKVAVYGRPFDEAHDSTIALLFRTLEQHQVEVCIHERFLAFLRQKLKLSLGNACVYDSYYSLDQDVRFMLSIGGDGTFLKAVSFVRQRSIPIIGINVGRLGFLADIKHEDIGQAVQALENQEYTIEERTLLEVATVSDVFQPYPYALNEAAVMKKDTNSMITVHTYLNDVYLNSYWADGLIVATPTGSTAYSMSVGGPIILPKSRSLVITPVAPHNLTARPIVVPDEGVIRLRVESRTPTFMLTLDSRSKALRADKEVIMKKARHTVKILKLPHYSFYETLRNKLMWGMDTRN